LGLLFRNDVALVEVACLDVFDHDIIPARLAGDELRVLEEVVLVRRKAVTRGERRRRQRNRQGQRDRNLSPHATSLDPYAPSTSSIQFSTARQSVIRMGVPWAPPSKTTSFSG